MGKKGFRDVLLAQGSDDEDDDEVTQQQVFTPPKYVSGGYYKGDAIERLHCENLFVIKASFDCK